MPHRIGLLVYVCAALLRNGESLIEAAKTDRESLILPNLVPDEAAGTMSIKPDAVREIFFHDCPDDDARRAASRLQPEPLGPTFTPLQLTDANFGRVPRVYITCRFDRAVGPELQARMVTALPCQQVITMDTGHSPFYAAPAELAQHVLAATDHVVLSQDVSRR
jgi:pimeloyl-ACP methyl ester carboxylesterase